MSVRTEPNKQQVAEAEALYQKLKEGKAKIPKPSWWMRLSLKTKLTGFVLWLIGSQILSVAAHFFGPVLGIHTSAIEMLLTGLSISGIVAGIWLLFIQNQMMTIINRIIGRLDNIAQGDLTDPIPLHRVDELGKLNDSLVTMQTHLKAMMAQSGAIFGGEHSGHFYFKDFWKADSGALAALHAIAALGSSKGSLSKLLKPYQRYFSSGEINSKVKDAQHSMSVIEKQYADLDSVTIDHLDGLTVNGDTWWFNLRPSNTEPLLRLNVEAKTLARMEKIKEEVLATVRK
jgi:HAMP domain-containing protein